MSPPQILSLHGIGQVRALRLLTVRNAGHVFASLEDLQDIGMNDKTIEKFLKSNAAAFVL
jgi:DNA uptake protein ComE-like DNA-binding protein